MSRKTPACSFFAICFCAIILMCTVVPLAAQAPLAHWKFDEGSGNIVFDSSGNGHHGFLSNGALWVNGTQGWAISATGANKGYATLPAIDLRGTRAVTITFWAQRNYTVTGGGALLEAGENYQSSTTGFALLPDDDTCRGIRAVLRGNTGITANCYSQPSSGVWHHLAVVYDKTQTGGDEVRLYVDGELQNPAWNAASATNTNDFGKNRIHLFSRAGSSLFSSGTVKDLCVYGRALQGEEIQQIYNDDGPSAGLRLQLNDVQSLSSAARISYVQGNYAAPQTPQTRVSVTYTAAQNAGDLNLVVVGWNDSTATVTAVTDSKGNTYTRAVGPTIQSGVATQSIYYARNIVAAGARTNTVTVTFSTGASYPDIRILEYSGADRNNPVDVTAAASGNSTTSNSGSATTTGATDLIFGANLVQTLTSGPGSGFTRRILTVPDGDIAEDRTVTTTGSYNATAPVFPSGKWIMQMVAFRTPVAAGFTITASPSSLSIAHGQQGTSTITTAISGGFNSAISLSATGVPTGTTVSFNPNPIPAPGSGSSTMTITVGASTPTGTYPITVTGSGGGMTQSTTVTLTVTAPSFNISASPSSLSIVQGHQGTSTITTAVSNGFNSSITLSASGVPTGTTVSFSPNPIPAPGSGTSTMTITVGSSTPTGTYPITVTGNGGGVQQSTTVTLTVTAPATFTISASPSSLSIAQGNQGTSTITTAISNGFNSSITLSASGVPTGTTVSFSPNPIAAPGSGSSTMTISVGSSTPTGTYPITVTGSGGGMTQSTTVTLTVTAAASFSLSASPSSLSIVQGHQGTSTITAAISNGFNSSISLSASGVPSGTTVSFSPNPIPAPGSGSSTMTINVGASTPTGTYPITVTGSGGGMTQSTTVTLTVTAPANFTLSASPSSLSIVQGHQGTSTITAAISNGFNSSISLSASGAPSGTTVSFSPNPIPAPGSGSSTMTINVGASTPTGTYPITVTGSGGGMTQSTTVTLTVTAPASFTLSASPSSLTITEGNQGTSTITAAISNGFNSSISLSASGVPSGTTVSFSPNPIPAPGSGSSTMTITVGSSTPTGTYPITVTGSGGGMTQSTTVTLTVTAPATFTISASPSSLTLAQGSQGTSTITTTVLNGFNSSIALSASGMPSGTTVSFNPSTIPAPGSGTSTMTVTVGSSTPAGTYSLTVTGNGGGVQQSAVVTLTVTASAGIITYVQGNYATPQSPQTTVNVTFSAAQVEGDLNVVVVGWNNSTSSVSSVTDSNGNTYALAAGPTIISGTASQSIYYARNINAAGAGANTVTVAFSAAAPYPDIRVLEYSGADRNSPVDVTAATSGNSSNSSSGSATTTNPTDLIFGSNYIQGTTTGPGTGFTQRLLTSPDSDIAEDHMVSAIGSYSATAPVTSGWWIMQMVAFRTPIVGSFTISASPSSLTVGTGNQGTSTITTAVSGGFNSAITLSASGVPTGTTVSFSPNPIAAPGSGNSTMTIVVGSNTPSGTYPITVTGSGGGVQQSTTVTLTVTSAPSFTVSASPSSLTVLQETQGTSTITVTVSNGFNSSIALSASGVPSGTTVSFNPATLPAPGSGTSIMTITVGTTLQGTYPITVTATGGGIHQTATVNLTVTAQVMLSWTASQSPGIAGYNIYRGTTSGGPYTKINSSLDPNTTYNDTAVQDGVTYYYVTTAVDNQGEESSYSNESSAGVP